MTESVVDIIRKIDPSFPVDTLLAEAGGRAWYIPKRDFEGVRLQILADPCREIRVIARRYRVSRQFVYRVWRAA